MPAATIVFRTKEYDLAATLDSGQAFRWEKAADGWVGVVGHQWVRLKPGLDFIEAATAVPVADWEWLKHYLQLRLNLESVLETFPKDLEMAQAVRACNGLRLLRQEPWECLASFIISSTKQIVQIRQIIALLSRRFGAPLPVLPGYPPAHAFPAPQTVALLAEADLRDCKMGFRARFLLETARRVTENPSLLSLHGVPLQEARQQLQELPGVGRKIADCVLLFAYGYQQAFPVDVWVARGLHELYFPRKSKSLRELNDFAATHFGPYAGFAQQYLFHYFRTQRPRHATAPATSTRVGRSSLKP